MRATQMDTAVRTLLCLVPQRHAHKTTTQKHRAIHTVTQMCALDLDTQESLIHLLNK